MQKAAFAEWVGISWICNFAIWVGYGYKNGGFMIINQTRNPIYQNKLQSLHSLLPSLPLDVFFCPVSANGVNVVVQY